MIKIAFTGSAIEKITVINGAVPVYKFTIPKRDAFGNYSRFSAKFLVDEENYRKFARVRAYGAYPFELFKDLGDIVFLDFDEGDIDRNGSYLLSNTIESYLGMNEISHSAGPYSWFTVDFPLDGMRHPRYDNCNLPDKGANGVFYFALGLGTGNINFNLSYYVKEIALYNNDGTKKIFAKGSGFPKPAFAGYPGGIPDISRIKTRKADILALAAEYDRADYYSVRQIYPWLYSIFDPQNVYCYLAVGNDRALLYDAVYGIGNLPALIRKITDKPLDVVLGHGHLDHVNGAYQFEEAWIHEDDFELCKLNTSAGFRLSILDGQTPPDGFNPETYIKAGAGNIKKINIGRIFDLGGLTMEVIAMEGHTAGSIGVLAREHRVLLDGDAADPYVWMFLEESLPVSRYITMLERVIKLDFDTFFTGHSDTPFTKSDFQKFINVARNASMAEAQPYQPDKGAYSYHEDGVMIVFSEEKLK